MPKPPKEHICWQCKKHWWNDKKGGSDCVASRTIDAVSRVFEVAVNIRDCEEFEKKKKGEENE